MEKYFNLIISILSGLSVCIPLAINLVNTVRQLAQEKNWNAIVRMVFDYTQAAEDMFTSGAEKKAWVLAMIEQSAKTINYDYNDENKKKVSDMIDKLCEVSKVINVESYNVYKD